MCSPLTILPSRRPNRVQMGFGTTYGPQRTLNHLLHLLRLLWRRLHRTSHRGPTLSGGITVLNLTLRTIPIRNLRRLTLIPIIGAAVGLRAMALTRTRAIALQRPALWYRMDLLIQTTLLVMRRMNMEILWSFAGLIVSCSSSILYVATEHIRV